MDIEGVTVVRYFGNDHNLTLSCEIETLGVGCFSACSGLSSLVFEGGSRLKRIEAEALSHCSGLKSICIPASVEILCAGCFSWSRLSSLTFEAESKLNEIEANVFTMCLSLKSLSIPASVKIIHGLAFAGSGISRITIEEGNAIFAVCGDFLINVTGNSIGRYFGRQKAIALDGEIESLCPEYFSPSSFRFEPGSKLIRIEAHAFASCSVLKLISIPASVESLGDGSFSECPRLSSLAFDSGSKLVRIEARVFFMCDGLESISIPASVESLGEECFSGCSKLSSVNFDPGSRLVRIEFGAFRDCRRLLSISIPASVESIGNGCFAFCDSLSSVNFDPGSKLVRIHAGAFFACWLLESIVIPRSIQELLDDWAAGNGLRKVTFESAASLQRMLDNDCVDLGEYFVIKIDECDSDIDSLGSSIGRRFEQFSHLVQ
jgi:hypothetical protein